MKNISRIGLLAASVWMLAAPAYASEETPCDECSPPPSCEECGTPTPPVQPSLPTAIQYGGSLRYYGPGPYAPYGYQDGGLSQGKYNLYYFGDGSTTGTPIGADQPASWGSVHSGGSLQTTIGSGISTLATTQADGSAAGQAFTSDAVQVLYTLHATTAAAAAAVQNLIDQNSPLASASGNYQLSASGSGYASVQAISGNSLTNVSSDSFFSSCGMAGVSSSPTTCTSGAYSINMFFGNATDYQDGQAGDFVATLYLSSNTQANFYYAAAGAGSAYIDPSLSFSNLLSQYSGQLTLSTGGMSPQGLDFDASSAAPEPASWAMLILGFGVVGAAIRRRNVAVRFA